MRIALCLERFDPAHGGQAIWTRGFASWLCESGHEVHVVSCAFGATGLPIRTHGVPWCWSPLARARRFSRVLRALDPDAIHDAGVAAARGVWQPHTGSDLHSLDRLIATETPARRARAALSPKMRLLRSQMRILETVQARRATRIVAVSPLVRRLLAARHPGAADRIETVMNGVDTRFFHPDALAPFRAETRRALGVTDAFLYLVVAHNLRLKGLDTALRALSRLTHEGVAIRMAVVGGAEDADLRRLAHRLGLTDKVLFLGLRADMRPVYAAADALLHPTRWDACSLVVLEGLACGLPVVTTLANGAAEAIQHDDSGLVLENPEDAEGLARLMRLPLSEGTRAGLAARARQAALAHDIRANYRAVESLLLRVARGTRAGAA